MTLTIEEEAQRRIDNGKCFRRCGFYGDRNPKCGCCPATGEECLEENMDEVRRIRAAKRKQRKEAKQ